MKFKVPMMYKVRKIAVYHFLKPFLVPGLLRFKDLKNNLQKWCDGHRILNNP